MAILRRAAFLNRLGSVPSVCDARDGLFFGSDVPLQQVAGLCGSDNNVGVIWVEDSFCDFILTGEHHLRPSLKTQAVQVNQTVGFIHGPFVALAIARQQ